MNYEIHDITRQIASILRGLMARYGVTQLELATAIGVSQSQVSKMIRGTRSIDLDQFAGMCEALGVSPAAIFKEAEDFLLNMATPAATSVIYVAEGQRLDKPVVVSELPVQWTQAVVPRYVTRSRTTKGEE